MELKLLIAEDEKVERQALRVFISRSFPEIHILEDAINGIELLRKVEKEEPQIVISDIEMPGLTGLEALDALKQRGFKGKLIIQTAYSNFEYARKALSLGAEAYLLKPIKKENLISLLETVIADLNRERRYNDEKDRYEEIFKEMRPFLDRELISAIQMNEIRAGFADSYLKQILPANSYTVITIDRSLDHQKKTSLELMDRESYLSQFQQFITPLREVILGGPVNAKQTFLIGHQETESYRAKIDSINLAEKLKKEFSGISIGIGKPVFYSQNLSQSYKESLMALKSDACQSGICHFGDLSGEEILIPNNAVDKEKLRLVIFSDRVEVIDDLGQNILSGQASSMGLSELKDALLNDLMDLIKELPAAGMKAGGGTLRLKGYLDELLRIQSREESVSWFISKIKDLWEIQKEKSRNIIHQSVYKAQEYIKRNYMRDISLDIVSEEIGISPYHLSHLFRQELNISYKKYLTSVRIDMARELVQKGKYDLKELSRLCGYNNPVYFSRVFQKETGCLLEERSHVCHMIEIPNH